MHLAFENVGKRFLVAASPSFGKALQQVSHGPKKAELWGLGLKVQWIDLGATDSRVTLFGSLTIRRSYYMGMCGGRSQKSCNHLPNINDA